MIDELLAFSVFMKARYANTLTTELLAGNRVREMFVRTTTAQTTQQIFNGMTEYQLARFGKLIYENYTDATSNSLWTACSPYSPKQNRSTTSIETACRKLNWMISALVSDLNLAQPVFIVTYTSGDSRKVAYDVT